MKAILIHGDVCRSPLADNEIFSEIDSELMKARLRFPKFHSAHEGYAVIEEEIDELRREVFKKPQCRSQVRLRREAIQVAAMAVRFITDVLEHVNEL